MPWYAKALAAGVAGYALSPLDLIPDFIPVLGLVDDLVIVPLGIILAVRMIPATIMTEHRAAAEKDAAIASSKVATGAITVIWAALTGIAAWLTIRYLSQSS